MWMASNSENQRQWKLRDNAGLGQDNSTQAKSVYLYSRLKAFPYLGDSPAPSMPAPISGLGRQPTRPRAAKLSQSTQWTSSRGHNKAAWCSYALWQLRADIHVEAKPRRAIRLDGSCRPNNSNNECRFISCSCLSRDSSRRARTQCLGLTETRLTRPITQGRRLLSLLVGCPPEVGA
jgi:hypothetical protein